MYRRLPYKRNLTVFAQELRGDMTPAERKLWYQFLSGHEIRFLRQRPIGSFIPDFYCASRKLVIELDGLQHYTPDGLARDATRTAYLESLGLRVIRFTNAEVMNQFRSVCLKIQQHLEPKTKPTPNKPPRPRGSFEP
jgi:very-short-patch-repair endonuclease